MEIDEKSVAAKLVELYAPCRIECLKEKEKWRSYRKGSIAYSVARSMLTQVDERTIHLSYSSTKSQT